ncbi:hypothetical protein [Vibrio sp.]|uniref:hypothetical protein n=1 Tax=Vibrio sp. TaxID=678 RepID=UPI003AA9A4CC
MEFIVLIFAILIALFLFRLLGFLAPFVFIALGVGVLINRGWNIYAIGGMAVGLLAIGIYGYYLYQKKTQQQQTLTDEELQEYARKETERLNKIWKQ